YQTFVDQLTLENNQLNCTILKTGSAGELSTNNLLIAEALYDQPQLLGVPFLSNSLTDPIPFYSRTAMRLVSSREADTTNTVGPVCELLPITFPESALDDPDNPTPGQSIDAFQGSAPGNFGWVHWNSDPSNTNGVNYIEESLANPRLSMTDFIADEDDPDCAGYAPGECPDTAINIGDWVAGRTGVGSSGTVDDLLESYVGKTVLVPVYDDIGSGLGSNASYEISHFALITVDQVCLPRNSCPGVSGNEKLIRATLSKYDDEACSGNTGGTPRNNLSVAVDDTATTDNETPIVINLLGNDSDPDGDTLTLDSFTDPAKGSVIDNGDGTVTYTPRDNNSGIGTFTFTYTISDGHGSTDAATVTVTVTEPGANNSPIAVDDSATTAQDTAVTVDVVSNDSDLDGDTITVNSVGAASNGSVVNNGNGTVTYTPAAGFSGSDSFTYAISDGNGGTATATVSVMVTAAGANNSPVAVDDSSTTAQATAVTVDVVSNDSDLDGDTITVDSVGAASNGSVVNNGNGTVTYTPTAGFSGSDSFTYTISDGNGGTATATVSVTVNLANDPPVAVNDSATTNEDTAVAINVGSNDSDPNGDALVFSNFSDPANGSVVNNGVGAVTYTPDFGFNGTDSFTYQIDDGNGGTATATVSVVVNIAQNNPPVANDDSISVDKNNVVTINVLGNDSDPDNDSLTIDSLGAPVAGGSVVDNGDGTVTFTPTNNYVGNDRFTYTISDGNGGTDTATVVVTINDASLPTLHVSSISVDAERSRRRGTYWGEADVYVVDGNGNKVGGATVQGIWTGPQPGGETEVTNSSQGKATFETAHTVGTSGTYQFCVTSITKGGYIYDPGANVETCDSDSS
ncbi:Ig-like domain-containing protein, partial [Chloroflexota bacterium]